MKFQHRKEKLSFIMMEFTEAKRSWEAKSQDNPAEIPQNL